MKTFKLLSILLLLWSFTAFVYAQDNSVTPQRMAEQEALKQTEKLQQELDLSPEQARQVYEINLKYARERQVSNTRSAAMQRMKNKNADIEQVLNEEQNNRLQSKRYERSTYNGPALNANPGSSSNFRSSPTENRTNPGTRTPSTSGDRNIRNNNYRTTTPDYQSGTRQAAPGIQRTPSANERRPQFQNNNQQPPRTSEPASNPTRQTEVAPQQSAPSRQSTPANSGSRREAAPSSNNSGRR